MDGNFTRLLVEMDIVNIQTGGPWMNTNRFDAAGIIREAGKATVDIVAGEIGKREPTDREN